MPTYALNDLIAVAVAAGATTSHLYVAALGFSINRQRAPGGAAFAIAMVSVAWYTMWIGLLHLRIFDSFPGCVNGALVLGGFATPAL